MELKEKIGLCIEQKGFWEQLWYSFDVMIMYSFVKGLMP